MRVLYEPLSPGGIRKLPLEEAHGKVQDLYRLKPDRRFLFAIAELNHFASGKKSDQLLLEFRENRWEISSGGEVLGVLPEFANYSDAIALLAERAKRLAQPGERGSLGSDPAVLDAIRKEIEQFLAPHLERGLRMLDERWALAGQDPDFIDLAARAFVWLSLQSPDRLEVADQLPGRAWRYSLSLNLAAEEQELGTTHCWPL